MESRTEAQLPVAVIGAGPVGLAAAAHLTTRNLQPVIFERGSGPADAVRKWSHVRVFSPWAYNIDTAARLLLEETHWNSPDPDGLPTGAQLLTDYLEPLAGHPKIASSIHFHATVNSISRKSSVLTNNERNDAPFVVSWMDREGTQQSIEVKAVIDASGTWFSPNPMGVDGQYVPGERNFAQSIHYAIPDVLGKDRETYAGKTVLVVGAGHSAINAVLELLKLQDSFPATRVIWSLRRNRLEKLFGGGLNDKLPARGELGNAAKRAIQENRLQLLVPFVPQRIEKSGNALKVFGLKEDETVQVEVDQIIVATGFRPDIQLFRELRVSLDPVLEAPPALAPLIDPNVHSCGTVPPHGAKELSHPEPGFYIVGSKSYGRAPTFLMATGYEQVRSVVAEIAGDRQAASEVRLVLPETGVCSAGKKESSSSCCGTQGAAKKASTPVFAVSAPKAVEQVFQQKPAEGCCGGPAPEGDSCCVKDHEAKLSGKAGCGCNATQTMDALEVRSSCCATA